MQTWPGAELVSARSIERTLRRQRVGLALLVAIALVGLWVHPAPPDRLLGYAAVGAAIGIVALSVGRVYERDRGDRSADALIEAGFRYERRADDVSRAVADRVRWLESDRKRRSLAGALRANLELEGIRRSPGALRCAAVPAQRGFGDHRDVVERIASTFERGACNPRAIIEVERLLTMPPAVPAGDEARVELGRRLRGIARLIEAGS